MSWIRGHTIGNGSSAAVSVAISQKSGELFAVKSTELSNSHSLQKEAEILSKLNCKQIVEYRGCDVTMENNHLVFNLMMELLPAGTAAAAARRRGGGIEECWVRRITREIVQGIAYLHCNGIVHCDIKGENILLGQDGAAKIADFGCSKRVDFGSAGRQELCGENSRIAGYKISKSLFRTQLKKGSDVEEHIRLIERLQELNLHLSPEPETDGAVIRGVGGTPLFMAPEVAQGKEQGFAADIWALGCTVIEMATGGAPWPAAVNPGALLYKIAFSGESPPIPDFLSSEAKDFLGKCLRIDPRERWTAEQLLGHPFLGQFSNSTKKKSFINPVQHTPNLLFGLLCESSFKNASDLHEMDSVTKQNQDSNTISPTSVLDQGIWSSSMEDWEKGKTVNSLDSPMKRLTKLCWNSETTSDCVDSCWITVRTSLNEEHSNSNCSSIFGQLLVCDSQTLEHQKVKLVNQLQLFYIVSSYLLLVRFYYSSRFIFTLNFIKFSRQIENKNILMELLNFRLFKIFMINYFCNFSKC